MSAGFRIRIDGVALEAQRWGPADGPQIAMLHEGLGCVAMWRDFPERLVEATGWGVVAWSRAGYGGSDPCDLPRPINYMSREAAKTGAVLDALGFQTGVLFGHSDGGTIASEYLGRHGDARVRGLVVISPHYFVEDMSVLAIEAAKRQYKQGDLKGRLARRHAHPDVAFYGWCDSWLNPAFRRWDVTECLASISCPVLALQGEDDAYGSRAQVEAIADRAPGPVDVHMIPDAAHAAHLEAPETTLSLIRRFIAGLP